MKDFDRKTMIARMIVANVFRYDILDYACMTDNELLANYLIMLDTLEADKHKVPADWEIEF